jgi:hypothetical protein
VVRSHSMKEDRPQLRRPNVELSDPLLTHR